MKIISLTLLSALFASVLPGQLPSYVAPGRKNYLITITAGTPIQVTSVPVTVDRMLIEMDISSGGGYGSICIVPVGTTRPRSAAHPGN